MQLEEYALRLGMLVGNFQSLEFLLRACLYEQSDPPHSPLTADNLLQTLSVGDEVEVNAVTDYSSLGDLVDRYNALMRVFRPELVVDRSLTDIRDALAHGRISTIDPARDLHLLKFDRPATSKTTVSFSQALTSDWFERQTSRVVNEMKKVALAHGRAEFP